MATRAVAGGGAWAQRLEATLLRTWTQRGLLAILLLPLSWFYAAVLALRCTAYRLGLQRAQRVPCAVIVVGNVVVGGAGKTPTTIAIVQHLRARGVAVGVVSRGYGRSQTDVRQVQPGDDATETGDEPLLMARATGVPVFVGRKRHAAAIALLAQHPRTQVIVCDDGLQHYPLYRDLEICVSDERGIGNGWLLPAGPLREPWPRRRLPQVGQASARQLLLQTGGITPPGSFTAHRQLANHACTLGGDVLALASVQGPVLALAGIAKPESFFAALRANGVALSTTLPLPDHFDFSRFDTTLLKGFQVLCTEKDAMKLWKIWPQALAVPLQQTLEPAFLQALDTALDSVLQAKLSFPHGHQTT